MNNDNKNFRKYYKIYENKINLLIGKNQDNETITLKKQIESDLVQWEKNIKKNAKLQIMMLRALLAKINSFGGK